MQAFWSIMMLGSAASATCPLPDLADPAMIVTGQEIKVPQGLWIVDLEIDLANTGKAEAEPTDMRWKADFSAPAGAKGYQVEGVVAIPAISPGESRRLPVHLEVPYATVQDSGGQIRTELLLAVEWDTSDRIKECSESNRGQFQYTYVSPSLTPREVEEQTLSSTLVITPDPKTTINPGNVKGTAIKQPVLPRKPGSKVLPKPVDPLP